jgi:FlaG/FlaF family flagellin (archaellin)
MKEAVTIVFPVLIIVCALASVASGQSTPQGSGASTSVSHGDSANQLQTITGRIIELDTKSGVISVRASDTGRVRELNVDKDVVAHLRRGERVIITYSGKTAKKIQATRSGR